MNIIISFLKDYINELSRLFIEMSPWLIFGLLFAGILRVFFPQKHIEKFMGKNNLKSVVNASLLGVPLPLCSCGVIPTGISLYRNGASRAATTSFLISTPQTGIDSVMATYSLLGWPFALIRPLVALLTGILGGIITKLFFTNNKNNENNNIVSAQEIAIEINRLNKNQNFISKIIYLLRYAFIDFLKDISKWLVIGFLFAGLISVLVPDGFFTQFSGNTLLEMLVILIISIPLYICATGSVPVAAVLLLKGVSPGAALVFLMAGPATNFATISVIGSALGRKSLLAYLFSIIAGSLGFGFLINTLFPIDFFITGLKSGDLCHQNHLLPSWFNIASGILLFGLILYTFFIKMFNNQVNTNTSDNAIVTDNYVIRVTGMNCSHCEANVVKNLKIINGISEVTANHETCKVAIEGKSFDKDRIEETIKSLGYKYLGEFK